MIIPVDANKAFSRLLNHLKLARQFGFRLRANTVVCNTSMLLRQLAGSDSQMRLWDLFDEWFLIADYRSSDVHTLESEMMRIVESICDASAITRKRRIGEYLTRDNKKISIASCTITESSVEADEERDFYIRPPGKLVTRFVPGFAYK